MLARKLGRLAGLVFVLSVVFGGIGAASAHEASADTGATQSTDSSYSTNKITEWD